MEREREREGAYEERVDVLEAVGDEQAAVLHRQAETGEPLAQGTLGLGVRQDLRPTAALLRQERPPTVVEIPI
jgi:hypothetical protein